MSNVTILIQGIKIYSFRAIIESRFPDFYKSSLIKKKREKKNQIQLILKDDANINEIIILQILDYLYTGEIDFVKNPISTTLTVLYTAYILHIDRLEWLCEQYLHSIVGINNVYEMYVIADKLSLSSVKTFCTFFVHKNWGIFSSNKLGLDILGLDLFQELTISVSKKEEIDLSFLKREEPKSSLEANLRDMFSKMLYADATAELTDGKLILFHRAIVAAFDKSFFNFLNAAKENQKTIKFPIDSEAFSCLLRFMYYGGTNDISVQSAASIIEEMIPKFQLPKFRDICEDTLMTGLTLESVLRILKLTYLSWNTDRKKLLSLRKDCLTFIAANFAEVNVPSIRDMDPNIAFDLLELMHDKPPRVIRKKDHTIFKDSPNHTNLISFA